jgi:hypothetical protein
VLFEELEEAEASPRDVAECSAHAPSIAWR